MTRLPDDFDAQLTRLSQPLAGHEPAGPGRDAALKQAQHAWLLSAGAARGDEDERPQWLRYAWLAAAACMLLAVATAVLPFRRDGSHDKAPLQASTRPALAAKDLAANHAVAVVYSCRSEHEAFETQQKLEQALRAQDPIAAADQQEHGEVALLLEGGKARGVAVLFDRLDSGGRARLDQAIASSGAGSECFETAAMVFSPGSDWGSQALSASLHQQAAQTPAATNSAGEQPLCIAWPSALKLPDGDSLLSQAEMPMREPDADSDARTAHNSTSTAAAPAAPPAPQHLLGLRPYTPPGQSIEDKHPLVDSALKTYLGLPEKYWDCQILVEEVRLSTPAARAGLRKGDMLLSARLLDSAGTLRQESAILRGVDELRALLKPAADTDQLELKLLRSGQVISVKLSLDPASADAEDGWL